MILPKCCTIFKLGRVDVKAVLDEEFEHGRIAAGDTSHEARPVNLCAFGKQDVGHSRATTPSSAGQAFLQLVIRYDFVFEDFGNRFDVAGLASGDEVAFRSHDQCVGEAQVCSMSS